MAKRKATAEELFARSESNGYKKGAHREEDGTRENKKHKIRLRSPTTYAHSHLPARPFKRLKAATAKPPLVSLMVNLLPQLRPRRRVQQRS